MKMHILPPHPPRSGLRRAILFSLALSLVFLALAIALPIRVQADAGPFPTRTPTVTHTPLPTNTPTGTPLPTLQPTPTITLFPTLTPVALEEQEQPLPVTGLTPEPPDEGGGWFACWPIALIFILAVIIASTYLLTRRAQLVE